MEKWKTLDKESILDHPRFRFMRHTCKLPDGRIIDDYYVLEENDIGTVFALTPERELILVEQYKHGIDEFTLELPAGLFEDRTSNPEEEARREFNEETGYDASEFLFVGKLSNNPTRMNSYFHVFAAVGARLIGQQHLDTTEEIQVRLIPLDEVFPLIRTGRINENITVAAIYLARDFLKEKGLI